MVARSASNSEERAIAPTELRLTSARRALVEHHLRDTIVAWQSTAWGYTTPSARLTLATGRRFVAQLHAREQARRITDATRILRAARVPVPGVRSVLSASEGALVIFQEIAGQTAASLMGRSDNTQLAAELGAVLTVLRRCVPSERDRLWLSQSALRMGATDWLEVLDLDAQKACRLSVRRVSDLPWGPVASHGDFVPANALIDRSRPVALIDLGDFALRHPLVDPAWWLLVVRHHHFASFERVAWPFIEATFATPDQPTEERLADVAAARAAQLHFQAAEPRRRHMRALLQTALEWADSSRRISRSGGMRS